MHVVDGQHQQNNRHHLHRELGHGQVRCRKAGEGQSYDQSYNAQQYQCIETLSVQSCRCKSAEYQHSGRNRRWRIHRAQAVLTDKDPQIKQWHCCNSDHTDKQQQSVAL